MAIPKKIHYCWLGRKKMPEDIALAVASWKRVMPDYEIILWDENRFDINSVPWVAEAYKKNKFALAADYIRLYAVYTEGGIYLDTDIYALKRLDEFLQYDYFTSLEYEDDTEIFINVINSNLNDIRRIWNCTFQSGLFGGIKGHPFLKDCLSWYETHRFILSDGTLYDNIIASDIYAAIAQKYGFRYVNKPQLLRNNMMILPSSKFTQGNLDITNESYAVHWWNGSWRADHKKPSLLKRIKRNKIIRKIFGKKPILNIEEKIMEQLEKLRENAKLAQQASPLSSALSEQRPLEIVKTNPEAEKMRGGGGSRLTHRPNYCKTNPLLFSNIKPTFPHRLAALRSYTLIFRKPSAVRRSCHVSIKPTRKDENETKVCG